MIYYFVFLAAALLFIFLGMNRERNNRKGLLHIIDQLKQTGFHVSHIVMDTDRVKALLSDEVHGQWALADGIKSTYELFRDSELEQFEVMEDHQVIFENKTTAGVFHTISYEEDSVFAEINAHKSTLKYCNSLEIVIRTNDFTSKNREICLIHRHTELESGIYQEARKVATEYALLLNQIMLRAKKARDFGQQRANEKVLQKTRELLLEGAITEEQFESIKERLEIK